MISFMKHFVVIALFVVSLTGVLGSPAFGIQMTIDAVDDAGQLARQVAYLKFVDSFGETLTTITTDEVSNRWTSSSEVKSYADDPKNNIPGPWFLQSAGNIWSSDTIVGDPFTAPHAGVYRISPVDGAFTYDSFNWSNVADKWLWQLQIYVVGGANYTLGSDGLYDKGYLALGANLGEYIDITLDKGKELIFWIADGRLDGDPSERNTIDNSGSLTFNVVLIPEPSTLILAVTGLFFLARRFRKHLSLH